MIGNAALGQIALGQADPINRTLTAGLFTNTSTVYSPTVSYDQVLLPDLFTNTSTFYSPTASQIFSLRPPLLTSTTTFGRAAIWADRNKQSETWLERSKQSEVWTRAA